MHLLLVAFASCQGGSNKWGYQHAVDRHWTQMRNEPHLFPCFGMTVRNPLIMRASSATAFAQGSVSSSRHVSNNCWSGSSRVMTTLKMPVCSMVRTRAVPMTFLVSIIVNMICSCLLPLTAVHSGECYEDQHVTYLKKMKGLETEK